MDAAERQRAYRQRVKNGEPIGPLLAPVVLPPIIELTPVERSELVAESVRLAHATLAGWLLNLPNKNTRATYRAAWQAWCAWCEEVGESWIEPRRQSGGAWLAYMQAQGLSAATRRVRAVAVRGALLELGLEGLRMGADPFQRVKLPKVDDVSSTVPLTDDEMARCMDAATALGGRYRTLVLLLGVVGLRATEAAQVMSGTVRDSPWGLVADIERKGGLRGLVPVPDVVAEAAAIDGWPLEGASSRRPRDRVTYMVKLIGERAGVAGLHPHQFRHWHVTKALASGVALERVQDSMNHASPVTTQRYNRARVVIEGHSAFTVARYVN